MAPDLRSQSGPDREQGHPADRPGAGDPRLIRFVRAFRGAIRASSLIALAGWIHGCDGGADGQRAGSTGSPLTEGSRAGEPGTGAEPTGPSTPAPPASEHGILVLSDAEPYDFVVEPEQIDLGTLLPDEDAKFEFEIVNRDERPLPIVNLDGSCECLAFRWTRGDLAPGERRRVATDVRAQNRGSKLLSVMVQANDRRVTTRNITIRYVVVPELHFDPGQVDFGKRMLGSSAMREVRVSYELPTDTEPIEFDPALSEPVPVRIEAGDTTVMDLAGGLRRVTTVIALVLDAAERVEPFETRLEFASPRHRPAALPLSGEVHRGAYLDRSRLHLGILGVGVEREASVRLVWTRDEPKIVGIDCSSGDLSADAIPDAASRSARIDVRLKPTAPGEFDETVAVRTDLWPEPLVLRVRAKVR